MNLHRINKMIYSIITIILSLLLYRIATFTMPTQGEPISSYSNPKSALLVVDMQEDLLGEKAKSPYKDAENLINNVNSIINMAAEKNFKIIYIRQEFKDSLLDKPLSRGNLVAGQPGAQLDSRVKKISEDDFAKSQSDGFSNQDLDDFLRSNEVDKLYIVGLDADTDVYKTAKGGLNRNYNVTIIQDGTTTTYTYKMDEILEKYIKNNMNVINSSEFKNLK